MRRVPRILKWRPSAITGVIAMLALVSLPVELTIGLVEHPAVVPPGHLASLLLIGSCLLLVGSGLGLRREEAARAAQRPTPSA